MSVKRREFLTLLGSGVGTAALTNSLLVSCQSPQTVTSPPAEIAPVDLAQDLGFRPIATPMPLSYNTPHGDRAQLTAKLTAAFGKYEVRDDLVLPEGFTYDVVAAWGDKLGDAHVGYNNDYLSFIPVSEDSGYLTANFEYVSALPWREGYVAYVGNAYFGNKILPFDELNKAFQATGKQSVDVFALPDDNPMKQMAQEICAATLNEVGIGVMFVRRTADGKWERQAAPTDRRITGLSGWKDGRYLKATGPAVAIFRKTSGLGYLDGLGDRIIGTFNNCAGGTSPWGTVFSAEENIQNYVPEPVMADGTSLPPGELPFTVSGDELGGPGNAFGLAGNKYGWMVEVDPANANDYGTKHTSLGRFRHEAVAIRALAGKPLVFYSGCDRRGGHLYKFISKGTVSDPKAKSNSQLLEEGTLYAAQFAADGSGRWIPLRPDTPVDPTPPTQLLGAMLPLPQRPQGGVFACDDDDVAADFKKRFPTLSDLYSGSDREKQGAILIDAHYAANAAGATCTARPEDVEIAPDGSLFIAFTSGAVGKSDGSPDLRIFKGPTGGNYHEYGWIMRLEEAAGEPGAMQFRWKMFATGGEPAEGGWGFANPDNLAFDTKGNLWIVTDMSSGKLNAEVPAGRAIAGKVATPNQLTGLYGSNSIWFVPTSGPQAGKGFFFGYGPVECEMTGPFFAPDGKTLFIAIQHPGEANGTRRDGASETRVMALRSPDGTEIVQSRQVPIGSNWPGKQPNQPPRPAIVAIRRVDGAPLV